MAETVIAEARPDSLIDDKGAVDETVTPGHLVEKGGSNKYQKHSTAGGNAIAAFALERSDIGDDIDTDYDSGDTVRVWFPSKGDKVRLRLGTGSTEVNISEGDFLESAGDGTVQKFGTAADSGNHANIVAVATEAVDNSGGSSEVILEARVI